MKKIILITQRLQKDYISFLHEDDSVPTNLHIGHIEAKRLMGTDKRKGLLTRFLNALYEEKSHDLNIINIIEEHTLADPKQEEEIKIFGIHTVEGTSGVEPLKAIKNMEKEDPSTTLIKSHGKNDFLSSNLEKTLKGIIGSTRMENIFIMLIGVRTDLNIQYLVYDLKYRLEAKNIAICSQLSTTSNRRTHYETLRHLKNVFNVKIYDQVDEFYRDLGLKNFTKYLLNWDDSRQTINFNENEIGIFNNNNDLKNIVKIFFEGYKDVNLTKLSEDDNGTSTFRVQLVDWKFRKNEDFILRIGKAEKIVNEKKSIEMVEIFLPSIRTIIVDYLDLGDWAAILYEFNNDKSLNTFENYYKSLKTQEQINSLKSVIDELIMYFRRIHKRSKRDKILLSDYYNFDQDYVSRLKKECETFLGKIPESEYIALKNLNKNIYNPFNFFKNNLIEGLKIQCYLGVTHGNLTSKNIIISEKSKNVYLINFSSFEEDLVLKDIAKFEIDLKFLCDITGSLSLNEIVKFEEFLLSSPSLQLPSMPERFNDTQFIKLYYALKKIRLFTDFITFGEGSVIEYMLALIKHTADKLLSNSVPKNLKVFAFVSLGMLIEKLVKNIT